MRIAAVQLDLVPWWFPELLLESAQFLVHNVVGGEYFPHFLSRLLKKRQLLGINLGEN